MSRDAHRNHGTNDGSAGGRDESKADDPGDPAEPIVRTTLHRGAKFDYEDVAFTAGDGSRVSRQIIRHPGAVIVLPILSGAGPEAGGDEDRIVLIRNRRVPSGLTLWELPAGTRGADEPPETTASRELIEETGYSSSRLETLGWFYTSPGLSDEVMHAFVARELSPVGQRLEADEMMTVHARRVSEVFGMLESGEIRDGKTMLTLLWAVRRGILSA